MEKHEKCMDKSYEIDAEIDEQLMRFRNCQFLVFCREYNVKIVFSHDQGCRKSIKNRYQIRHKSKTEKCIPESCKKH